MTENRWCPRKEVRRTGGKNEMKNTIEVDVINPGTELG